VAGTSAIVAFVDDDLQSRFDAISAPELRRRVDLALGYLRELRHGLAVVAGMTVEGAPGPLPELDVEQAKRTMEELVALLPLRRKALTPEERAKLQPFGDTERAMLEEVITVVAADPEAFDAAAAKLGGEVSAAQVLLARERLEKTDMLGEVAREMAILAGEVRGYQTWLVQDAAAIAAQIAARSRTT
jgi:hypothetical protein